MRYIIFRGDSPYWFIKLPGQRAATTKVRGRGLDENGKELPEKQLRENKRHVQQLRNKALAGDPETLILLGLSGPRAERRRAVSDGPTLGEWIDVWQKSIQAPKHTLSTQEGATARIRYWRALWGSRPIRGITREDVQRWVEGMQLGEASVSANPIKKKAISNGVSNVNTILNTLRLILKDALGRQVVRGADGVHRLPAHNETATAYWLPDPRDPSEPALITCCKFVPRLKKKGKGKSKPKPKHLTGDEIDRIFAALDALGDEKFAALFKLGSCTGQRQRSLIELERTHFDQDNPLLFTFYNTKNGKDHPMIIPQSMMDILNALPVNPKYPNHFFGDLMAMKRSSVRNYVHDQRVRAFALAGITKKLSFHHSTRATAAMRLYLRGWTTFQIMQFLNWESEAMVRLYIPSVPEKVMQEGADILGANITGNSGDDSPKSANILQMPKRA